MWRQKAKSIGFGKGARSRLLSLDEHEIRIFEMLNDNAEETSGFDPVNHPVIECKGEGHNLSDGNLSASHDRPILYLSQS
jgi:hypothetical protein